MISNLSRNKLTFTIIENMSRQIEADSYVSTFTLNSSPKSHLYWCTDLNSKKPQQWQGKCLESKSHGVYELTESTTLFVKSNNAGGRGSKDYLHTATFINTVIIFYAVENVDGTRKCVGKLTWL